MSAPRHSHPAATARLAERRRRVWAIRARVVGLSLATMLAASSAGLLEIVTGGGPALAHQTVSHRSVVTRSTGSGDTSAATTRSGDASTRASASTGRAKAQPSTVTTSAS